MKRLIVFLLIVSLLVLPLAAFAVEDMRTPHFTYFRYTNELVYGVIESPGDAASDSNCYFVRMIFYLPQGDFFVLIVPVEDGAFHAWISCRASCITLELVDENSAFGPGKTVYDMWTIKIQWEDAV